MSRRPSRVALWVALLLASLALPAGVLAAGPPADRTETPIASASPQTDVVASLVQLRVPLPAAAAPHPAACDLIGYERWRLADGPTDPTQADAVAVLMPGNLEGAQAFDPVARNTIRLEARRGRVIEVWAVDRRSNCLEDHVGLEHLERTGDRAAVQAYYEGTGQIDGQTFAGWDHDPAVLADLGVAQTVRDYDAILRRELPSQPWRERHVICGGHSLAGGLLDLYAGWDFDGDPATTVDAGYRQCAGFIGFETLLDLGLTSHDPPKVRALQALAPAIRFTSGDVAVRALREGKLLRHEEILGIGPETTTMLQIIANLAVTHPDEDATPWLRAYAGSPALREFLHLAGSANLRDFLVTHASARDLRFTFAGLLGHLFDDNGTVLGFIRASFGYPDGAPLIRNRLPEQAQLPPFDLLFQRGRLMIPRRTPVQALSGWRNYDALGMGAGAVGTGVTSPASEVTDAPAFARIMFEGPTDLIESWFPSRIVTDLGAVASGDRRGSLAGAVHPHAIRSKPRLVILGGNGYIRGAGLGALDPVVTLPGYEHLDVLTAAERQNDGRPEGSSTAFAGLIDRATGGE